MNEPIHHMCVPLLLSMYAITKHKSYLHLDINLPYAFNLWKDIKSHCQKPQMSPIYFVSSFSLSTPELLLPWVHAWLILSEKSCPLLQSSSVQANDLQHSNLNFLPDLGTHLAFPCVCVQSHWQVRSEPLGYLGSLSMSQLKCLKCLRTGVSPTELTVSSPSIMHLLLQSAEGNGNPLQYSCLENPMDGGAW